MPSLYDVKPRFQALLRPLVRRLAAAGVTANQVTVAAALLSFAAGQALLASGGARWALLCVPLVCIARMALNAVDGMLAREHGMQSRLGAMLNELGDVLADAALYLPFAALPNCKAATVVALVVLGIAGEMAGVVAVQIGASRRYDGPLGKSDRALFFSLLALLSVAGWPPRGYVNFLLTGALVLAAWTLLNRVRAALREAESRC